MSGAWRTSDDEIPQGSGSTEACAYADSWLATSSSIGLELFPNDGRPDCDATGTPMLSLAGTTTSHWSNPANWDHFSHSVPTNDSAFDGPSAVFDDTNGRMWATSRDSSGPHVWWTDIGCTTYPGSSGCAWHDASLNTLSGAPSDGHYTIAVHPLENMALLAFQDSNDNIRLVELTASGNVLLIPADLTVRTNVPHDVNDNCADEGGHSTTLGCAKKQECIDMMGKGCDKICKCGNPGLAADCVSNPNAKNADKNYCVNSVSKVHITTRFDESTFTSLAYLAYDKSGQTGGGTDTRFTSQLTVFNLDSQSVDMQWSVVTGAASGQTWDSVISVSGAIGSRTAGWFYYKNRNDPCNSSFGTTVSTDLFRSSSGLESADVSTVDFPILSGTRAGGFGDYVGAVRGGLSDGNPFVAWVFPRATTASCIVCDNTNRALQVRGAKVIP